MNSIEIEILEYSYWEHFKASKEISLILPINHPRRKKIEGATNDILKQLHAIKKDSAKCA